MTTVRVKRDYASFHANGMLFTCECGWKEYGREGQGAFATCESHILNTHKKGGEISFAPNRKLGAKKWDVQVTGTNLIKAEEYGYGGAYANSV